MAWTKLEGKAEATDLVVSAFQLEHMDTKKTSQNPISTQMVESLRSGLMSTAPPVRVEDELAEMERLLNTPKAERVRPPMPEPDPN